MATPHNLETLRRHLAAEADHDAVAAAACYVDDGWYEHLAFGLRFDGRDEVAAQYAFSYETMPDLAFDAEVELVDGDGVSQLGVFTGTIDGPLLGLEPTGRSVSVPMSTTYSFRDGLIESERVVFDLLTFAHQAGYEPSAIRAAAGHQDGAAIAAATVQRYATAKSRADVDAALAECTDDFELTTFAFRTSARGIAQAREQLELFFAVFPDYHVTVAGQLASPDVVTCWGTVQATMCADIGTIPATGRRLDLPFSCVFPIRDGRLAGEDFHFDLAVMCAQLGIAVGELDALLPAPASCEVGPGAVHI